MDVLEGVRFIFTSTSQVGQVLLCICSNTPSNVINVSGVLVKLITKFIVSQPLEETKFSFLSTAIDFLASYVYLGKCIQWFLMPLMNWIFNVLSGRQQIDKVRLKSFCLSHRLPKQFVRLVLYLIIFALAQHPNGLVFLGQNQEYGSQVMNDWIQADS